ncbi:MAG: pyridoxal-phosphate dependent enzyme [Actinomycetota bacterium]|nr:pyridoxal-phosphate dependent enzyme [Actinomycetota bacterium]
MAPPLDRRLPLALLPTPLEPADRLGAALGMVPGALWVKRDDLTGLGGGGNKARKLEYLCADALAQGADTLVTGGGPQSNHVRMTAAVANRLGLACTVVMAGPPDHGPDQAASGNGLLVELFGPEVAWVPLREGPMDYYAIEAAIDDTYQRLLGEGRRPYRMPIGGASAVGALGYVRAAAELQEQAQAAFGGLELVVVAGGSGGTHAGLAAGLGDHDLVLGVDVGARPDLDDQVPAKAAEVAALAGLPAPAGRPVVDHGRVGGGYGAATDDGREAVILAARTEGLILDPVYTGKAMAGLIAARRDGRIGSDTRTVFLHTGGMPALFAAAYARWLG